MVKVLDYKSTFAANNLKRQGFRADDLLLRPVWPLRIDRGFSVAEQGVEIGDSIFGGCADGSGVNGVEVGDV